MIKAIIFDCFGVLAEDGWLPLKRKYVGDNQTLADEIADLGKQNEYGYIDNTTLLEHMAKLMRIDQTVLEEALHKRVPNTALFAFIQNKLKPHYKIGLLTNANYNVLTDLFTKEQAALIDVSVMSFESKLIKPDPAMFALMVKRLGVSPEECLLIDDVERYCTAAETFGMQTIWWQSQERGIQQLKNIA